MYITVIKGSTKQIKRIMNELHHHQSTNQITEVAHKAPQHLGRQLPKITLQSQPNPLQPIPIQNHGRSYK